MSVMLQTLCYHPTSIVLQVLQEDVWGTKVQSLGIQDWEEAANMFQAPKMASATEIPMLQQHMNSQKSPSPGPQKAYLHEFPLPSKNKGLKKLRIRNHIFPQHDTRGRLEARRIFR